MENLSIDLQRCHCFRRACSIISTVVWETSSLARTIHGQFSHSRSGYSAFIHWFRYHAASQFNELAIDCRICTSVFHSDLCFSTIILDDARRSTGCTQAMQSFVAFVEGNGQRIMRCLSTGTGPDSESAASWPVCVTCLRLPPSEKGNEWMPCPQDCLAPFHGGIACMGVVRYARRRQSRCI
jgi:hypothetical protein